MARRDSTCVLLRRRILYRAGRLCHVAGRFQAYDLRIGLRSVSQNVCWHSPCGSNNKQCGVNTPEYKSCYQGDQETNQQSQQSHLEYKFAS